jgi:hypothetical protein
MSKNKREIINLSNVATLVIPNKVGEQIRFLHEQVGNTEWSGFLLTHITGSLADIDNIKVLVNDIFLCDIGDPHRTEYTPADHIEDCFVQFPQYDYFEGKNKWDGDKKLKGLKMAQVHTHHNMGSFFSQTDLDDLNTNAGYHGLYISLIVTMDGRYKAKGAFIAKMKETCVITPNDFKSVNFKIQDEVEKLITFDFDIEFETEGWFIDRYDAVKVFKKAQAKKIEEERKNRPVPAVIKDYVSMNSYKKTKNFAPTMPLHHTTLKDAGVKHHFYPGYGNVYTDERGVSYDDSGLVIPEAEVQMLSDSGM